MIHTELPQKTGKKIAGIILAGRLGAGKSSTGDALALELGYDRFSGGKFFRDEALQRGLTFPELHALMESDLSIDKAVDQRQMAYLNNNEHYVIDSRLGRYFAPDAFRVYLDLDESIAAERILKDLESNDERQSEHSETVEEVLQKNRDRNASNEKRYHELYGITDHMDPALSDIIINTAEHALPEVVGIIKKAYRSWLDQDES